MKLAEQVEFLEAAIAGLDTPTRRRLYREGQYPRAFATKDLDARYRWDIFYQVCRERGWGWLPDGVASVHIDTALRKVVTSVWVEDDTNKKEQAA